MNPRSPAWYERISVARSITFARFSSPAEILMLSTAVSIAGNVLRTFFDSSPFSNAVYRFGSNVSVCAIPPAIQSTMTASAVGLRLWLGSGAVAGPSARTMRGYPAASAPSVAADAVLRNSRRDQFRLFMCSLSPNQLVFRQHHHRPEQVFDTFALD